MVERLRNEYLPDVVSAPGETLEEVLEDRGMTQAELSARMGRPTKTINEIIKGKAAITPSTALQLERVLGVPASIWNNLERHYREYLAQEAEQAQLQKQIEWLKELPIRSMVKLGWIPEKRDKAEQVREALSYFGVASAEQWQEVYADPQVAFRGSATARWDEGAVAAWLRQGYLRAQRVSCSPFDAKAFKRALVEIRQLTVEPPRVFQHELVAKCAAAGVAVVFVRELPKAPLNGATRWLTPDKALILLSLRYKRADVLWFTFFHEAGHILLHGKRLVFIEGNGAHDELEEEANRFAANVLIPPKAFARLRQMEPFSKVKITRFAREVGVAPGIVVGRLQHEKLLPHTHCNDLKMTLEWA